MLTNFFGKSKPINFIVLLVLVILYFGLSFFEISSNSSVGFDLVLKEVGLLVLVLVYCFMYGFILSKNKLTLDNSFGLLILITQFGLFPEIYKDQESLVFNVLFLVFLRKVFSFRTSKSFFEKLFDSGFWLAILFILEPFSLLFGVLIYLSISLFQKINYQTLLIPFLGFIVPLILYFTYCYWFEMLGDFYALFYWYSSYSVMPYIADPFRIPLIFIGSLSVLAFVFKTPKVFLIRGNYRKYWIIVSVTFLLALSYIVLKNNKNGSELLIVFFPVSIMIANGIESIGKKFIKETVLLLFLVVPILLFIF